MSLTFSQKEQQHTNLVRTTLDNFVILSEGNIKDVKHIIKYYGIYFIDAEGSTFLHHANASNAAYLLSNGFTPLLDSVNNRNQTALFGSCAEKTGSNLSYIPYLAWGEHACTISTQFYEGDSALRRISPRNSAANWTAERHLQCAIMAA